MKKTTLALFLLLISSALFAANVNVTVDASANVHPYTRDLAFGTNFIGEWNPYTNYRANVYRFQQAGTRFVRFPGGSNSNEYHWNSNGYYDSDKIWHDNDSPNVTTFSHGFYNLAAHRGSLSKGYGKWAMVTDGDMSTYWLSYPDEPASQWIYLDIETSSYAAINANKVVIDWGTPYATQFKVQYSNANYNGLGTWLYNDTAWTDTSAGVQTGGTGAESIVSFNTVNAKYIRILCLTSSDIHNQYAIRELTVFNGTTQVTLNQPNVNQTASVSSSVALGDNQWDSDTMNFEQFMSVCRSMTPTAIPLITVNFYTGTTQEAADWVYYMNTYKGYGVKYFEVGNENVGIWEAGGPTMPEDYARRYLAFYDAMMAVDPTIVIAPQFNSITDPCNVTMTAGTNNAGASDYYIDTFLKYLADHGRNDVIKAISVHRYPTWEPASEATALATVDLWNNDMPLVKGWVNNRCANPGGVAYWVTEFNDGIDSGFTDHFYDSLFVSSYILNFLRNGGDQTCFFTAFGTPGPGQSDLTIFSDFGYLEGGGLSGSLAGKRYQPRASFYGLEMLYNDFSADDSFGNTMVSAVSGNTSLKAYANLRGDRKLSLELVNIDNANTMTANISISGFSPLASADLASYSSQDYSWVLNGSQSYAATDNPPGHSTLTGVSTGFSYNVPPYSIRIITMYDSTKPVLAPSSTPTMLPTFTPLPTPFPNGGALIDDCEHSGNIDLWGGKWEVYGDTVSAYSKVFDNMVCDGLGANGSNCHAQVTGTVASNSWGFGINCPLNANWSATDISMYDGLAFYYRGDGTAARVAFIQSDIPDSNFGCNIPDTTAWKLYQVPFTSLTHASFGTQTGTWTAKNIEAMQFQAGGAYGGSAAYRELDVDYVYLYKNTPTPTRTPLPTSTSTPYFSPTPTTTITATPVPVINTDINKIYVFPTSFNAAAGDKNICFNNMTPDSRVQIYDLRGELVYTGKSDNGKPVCWDLGGLMRNKRAASGLYIYVATDDKGAKVQGKLTVVK
jgi:hypothetical protein